MGYFLYIPINDLKGSYPVSPNFNNVSNTLVIQIKLNVQTAFRLLRPSEKKNFCVEQLSHILFVYALNMKASGFLIVSGEIN